MTTPDLIFGICLLAGGGLLLLTLIVDDIFSGLVFADGRFTEEGGADAAQRILSEHPDVSALEPTLKPAEGKFRVHFFTPEQTEDNMPKWKQVSDEIFR